jgi:hypothetical protein
MFKHILLDRILNYFVKSSITLHKIKQINAVDIGKFINFEPLL